MPERTIKGSYSKSFKKLKYRVSVENWDTGVVHVEDYEYYQGVPDGLWEYYTNGRLEYTTLWDNGLQIK